MLLSALLAANISACNFDSKGDIDNPSETVDSTKPKLEETDENQQKAKQEAK